LPSSVRVIVRDWLNANHIVLAGTHVSTVLAGRPLDRLVNTHCHSDHMGGNAAHACRVSITRDEAPLIEAWDEQALWLSYADQRC